MVLNSNIQGSFKKFSLFFRQTEMVFVIVWFLYHFTLKPCSIDEWRLDHHICQPPPCLEPKFKPLLMFFKLPVLTSNNVVWVPFSAILFDEAQHVIKTSTAGHVPVCHEVINLFIKPQNFLLMFVIRIFKGLYLIVTVCDDLLMDVLLVFCL